MLDTGPIIWRQCPNMNIAVDWDIKQQINKQTNKQMNTNWSNSVLFHFNFYMA